MVWCKEHFHNSGASKILRNRTSKSKAASSFIDFNSNLNGHIMILCLVRFCKVYLKVCITDPARSFWDLCNVDRLSNLLLWESIEVEILSSYDESVKVIYVHWTIQLSVSFYLHLKLIDFSIQASHISFHTNMSQSVFRDPFPSVLKMFELNTYIVHRHLQDNIT